MVCIILYAINISRLGFEAFSNRQIMLDISEGVEWYKNFLEMFPKIRQLGMPGKVVLFVRLGAVNQKMLSGSPLKISRN